MQEKLIYKNSVINFHQWGTGAQLLFCFNGYGESAGNFYLLEDTLGHTYRIIAIDLPFHGETEWKEGLNFTTTDLLAIIDAVCLRFSPSGTSEKISLLGYSMGGRICLYLLQLKPGLLERVVLLAPDGLYKNPWYRFATQTFIGKKLFYHTMNHPQWMFTAMRAGQRTGLLNKSIIRITQYYLDHEEERLLLYNRWITLRSFKPLLKDVKAAVAAHRIPVAVLLGRYDQLVLSKRGAPFRKGLETLVEVHIIEAGHQLLKEKYVKTIASLFYE